MSDHAAPDMVDCMTHYRFTRTRLGVWLGALAMCLTAITSPRITAQAATQPVPPVSPAMSVVPALSWADCGGGFQCATVAVPLDYRQPQGRTITLSVIKRPADEPSRRLGSLFVNPGGPGISAVATVRLAAGLIYTPEVLARFDIIGMDPRGVGGSTPIRCYDSTEEEAAFESDYPMFPVTRDDSARSAAKAADLANRCRARSGWELTHLSTANVARDMDLLRQAIGDPKLSYVGYSYGSYLGETYAAMFPNRVAAVVLDSVIDPTRYATRLPGLLGSMPFLREGSDLGAADTLAEFHNACRDAGANKCPFAANGNPAETFARLAEQLRQHPVTVDTPSGPVRVGYAELVSYTVSQLYAARNWPRLAATLHALAGGDAAPIAAQLPDRSAGQLIDEQQLGVLCSEVDTVDNPFLLPAVARAAEQRSPYAGAMWTYAGAQCVNWPGHDPDRYLGPWTARTATPALIVNSRHDPATPYRNAQALQRLMPGSRLLTHNGWGHETVLVSSCVDHAVERYLTEHQLPAPGAVCEPDSQPFG